MHRSPPDGSLPRRRRLLGHLARPRALAFAGVLACAGAAMLPTGAAVDRTASANAAPPGSATGPGNGFVVTSGDIMFILKQIKISERHAAAFNGDLHAAPANPDALKDPVYCQALLGQAVDQVPDPLTSYGLRTVDGSCNNLVKNVTDTKRDRFGAADQPFPRLASANFRAAEASPPLFGPPHPTTYADHSPGNLVFDTQPRLISNLIVDQTSTNPAAVDVAANPARTQANPDVVIACTATPPAPTDPVDCVPQHKTLFIPNITTDVGLSPPYNSLFTFFGQFFDHGVDQTVKSSGTVFVPLRADDPLITLGPDGIAGSGDEVTDPNLQFMVLTRAQNQPGPDGILGNADDVFDATNTDSPWVDQSQTYTSHPSHQFFLREYTTVGGKPVSTGKFLGGGPADAIYPGSAPGETGMSTWLAVKQQAAAKLGMQLKDTDVTNIPMIAMDPYGNYLPGPLRGMPQYVTNSGLVEGDPASPVPVPANVKHFDTPFLTDIAHNADPGSVGPCATFASGVPAGCLSPDADNAPSADFASQPAHTYDDEMLNSHFSCGDGRCNENIALSTIHQIFHSEHNRLVDDIDATLHKPGNEALLADFQAAHDLDPGAGVDDVSFGYGGRLFQAARFVTEMEYQHLVFEEFARKVQPAVRPFHVYSADINPAVEAEFAHAVYRFGHSMLDDDVARKSTKADGSEVDNSLPLLTAFLNPPEFFDNSVDAAHPVYTPEEAAGAIVMGSVDQTGNEIDEFVTETLRNNLLGLPLDLPAINMARARSEGIPPLNEVRRKIHDQTNDAQLAPYTSWADFGQHLKHPQSLVNFVAAYGTHPTITAESTITGKRNAARAIVDPLPTDPVIPDAADFMFGTGAWARRHGVTDRPRQRRPVGRRPGRGHEPVRRHARLDLQLRLPDAAREAAGRRPPVLPGPHAGHEPPHAARGQLVLRADHAEHEGHEHAQGRRLRHGRLQVPARQPRGHGRRLRAARQRRRRRSVHDGLQRDACCCSAIPTARSSTRPVNTVDPAGINGQSVYNGTDGNDRINGGNDNDTFWGGKGNDRIEGNGGDDVALGGEGNDIITDLDGADVPKGGPGNDAIDAGPGDDIPMGNEGNDFILGGANDNETFAGEGNGLRRGRSGC